MATKQQCERALRKIHPDCELEHDDSGLNWSTSLIAPPNHSWNGDSHSKVVHWYATTPKGEYWDCILTEILDLSKGDLVRCENKTCPSWFEDDNHGCDYWHEYNQEINE